MNNIIVHKTNNPEYGYNSKEELYEDILHHQKDVYNVLLELSYVLRETGFNHDWSKIRYFNEFARDTLERQDTPDFKSREWYKIHTTLERHHINANVPDNVNLIDILEMIVDCIVAGKTRTGSVNFKFLELDEQVLNKAYWNTIKLIDNAVELKK